MKVLRFCNTFFMQKSLSLKILLTKPKLPPPYTLLAVVLVIVKLVFPLTFAGLSFPVSSPGTILSSPLPAP